MTKTNSKEAAKRKRIESARRIGDYLVDADNFIINDTVPVKERKYYGSQRKDVKCIDEETGRFINVEMFSPVIYDYEQQPPAYNPSWEVHIGKGKESKKVAVHYPKKYRDWWHEQRRRCIQGYEVGGVKIPGTLYCYLNFWRITSKDIGQGLISPMFLDLDKEFFDLVEEARAKDKNLMVLKRRQIGFSEKCAFLCAYFYMLFPKAHTIIVSGEAHQATHTMGKALTGLDALSPYTFNAGREFYQKRLKDTPDFISSGFKRAGVDTGYQSVMEAITVQNNPSAVAGRSPIFALMEEVGTNPWLKLTTGQLLPAMKERGRLNGRIIVFVGTGGTMERGILQYNSMFYHPEENGLLAVDNIWDKGKAGTKCCPFFPAWKYHIQDYDGNSYEKESMIDILERREKCKNDKEAYFSELVSFPLTPEEAFNNEKEGFFNRVKLQARYDFLSANKADTLEQWGRLDAIKDGNGTITAVEWTPAGSDRFAKDADGDLMFPVCITEHPQDLKGFSRAITTGTKTCTLYTGGTDSYDKDKAKTSDSKGACSIYKGFADMKSTSNCHVAFLHWRPSNSFKFFEMTALMMLYYGSAKNLVEYSNITILQWYKANGLSFLLHARPDFVKAAVKNSQVNNDYGADPNTKHFWEDCFRDYINSSSDNIQSMDACERYISYRRSTSSEKYNCDLTIADMLAFMAQQTFGKKLIVNTKKSKEPLFGFFNQGGKIKNL